jgi:hypothetical protein
MKLDLELRLTADVDPSELKSVQRDFSEVMRVLIDDGDDRYQVLYLSTQAWVDGEMIGDRNFRALTDSRERG